MGVGGGGYLLRTTVDVTKGHCYTSPVSRFCFSHGQQVTRYLTIKIEN